jgi:hypothetical protein
MCDQKCFNIFKINGFWFLQVFTTKIFTTKKWEGKKFRNEKEGKISLSEGKKYSPDHPVHSQ